MSKSQHPDLEFPATIKFRLRLLQFSVLFSRFSSREPAENKLATVYLTNLRSRNRRRAREWWTRTDYGEEGDVADVVATRIADVDKVSDEQDSSGADIAASQPQPTFLDMLPLFMTLSAERVNLDEQDGFVSNGKWLQLAVEFMAHAFLEQRVDYNVVGGAMLRECFAWGPARNFSHGPDEMCDDERDDLFITPKLRTTNRPLPSNSESPSVPPERCHFRDENCLSADEFHWFRDKTLASFDPQRYGSDWSTAPPQRLQDDYRRLLSPNGPKMDFLRKEFEERIWEFLGSLAKSVQEVPLLRQLEERADGMRTTVEVSGIQLPEKELQQLMALWRSWK